VTRRLTYKSTRRGKPAPPRGRSFDPDLPVAGCYQVKLVRHGPPVAVKIWFGLPLDPVTGEELDRAPVWLARVNGGDCRPAAWFWPECARHPITEAEHDRITQLSRTMNRASAWFDPLRPIDPLKTPVPF
jgi:hypothetical protein